LKEVTYSLLDIHNEAELRSAAYIHESAPQNWDPHYKVTEERVLFWIDFLKNLSLENKAWIMVAKNKKSEVVGLHWLRLEEKYKTLRANIDSLWVHDDYRKNGIGSELKKRGEEWAKAQGAKMVCTQVFYSNQKMINFNVKLGFISQQVEMIKPLK
jgi:GNAT superfamily N-acetyltransferase